MDNLDTNEKLPKSLGSCVLGFLEASKIGLMLAPGCLAENLEMNEKLPPERYCHVDPNVYEVVYADALLPNKFGDGL